MFMSYDVTTVLSEYAGNDA